MDNKAVQIGEPEPEELGYAPPKNYQRIVRLPVSPKKDYETPRHLRLKTLAELAESQDEKDRLPWLNLLAVRSDCDSNRQSGVLDMVWLDAVDTLFWLVHPLPTNVNVPNAPNFSKAESVRPEMLHEYADLPWASDPRTKFCKAAWALARLGGIDALRGLCQVMHGTPRYTDRLRAREADVRLALDKLVPRLISAIHLLDKLKEDCGWKECDRTKQAPQWPVQQQSLYDKDVLNRVRAIYYYIANSINAGISLCAVWSMAPWFALGVISVMHPHFPVIKNRYQIPFAHRYAWGPTELSHTAPDSYALRSSKLVKFRCDRSCFKGGRQDFHHYDCAANLYDPFETYDVNSNWCNDCFRQGQEFQSEQMQRLMFCASWAELTRDFLIDEPEFMQLVRHYAPSAEAQFERLRSWAIRVAQVLAPTIKTHANMQPCHSIPKLWRTAIGPAAYLESAEKACATVQKTLTQNKQKMLFDINGVMSSAGSSVFELEWPFKLRDAPENSCFVDDGVQMDLRFYQLQTRMRAVADHMFVVGRNGLAAVLLSYVQLEPLALLVADYLLVEPSCSS